MPRCAIFFLGVCALPMWAGADTEGEAGVTPIGKVLVLLKDMLSHGISEKEAEATKFKAFSQWCTDRKRTVSSAIEHGEKEVDWFSARILQLDSGIRQLTSRIQELEEDVGRWTKDQKAIQEVRDKEFVDYQATLEDYSESISALEEALEVLRDQAQKRPQAELVQALIQVKRQRLVPSTTKDALAAFLQQAQPNVEAMPDPMLLKESPKAYGYEFQSGGVVDMLNRLLGDFSGKKAELMKEELAADHSYQQMMQQLSDNKENAQHEIVKKKTSLAEVQQSKADSEGSLAQTKVELKEDQTYLGSTETLCDQKSEDFKMREDLRAEEIASLQKAIDIISSDTVAGAGEKHLPALLQLRGSRGRSALAQARSGQQSTLQARASALLGERARLSGSSLLTELSQRVAENPFKKVKKLVKDLIVQLMEEATQETEHKGWCDTELTTNKQTRDSKTADVNSLTVEIDDLTANIAELTEDLSELAAGIKELEDAMASATSDRSAAKEANDQTIAEAKEAQVAVEQATKVLSDFYKKSARATSLAQQTPAEDAPETFDEPYKGMQAEGGNILDFLQVILTDFARLESETTADEAAEQDQYEKFMFESRKDKALKENESKHKDASKTDKESALHSAEQELKTTQEQLAAAVEYYEKLKPTCVDSGVTYEERVRRREEEIQSLQEALKILSGEDIE